MGDDEADGTIPTHVDLDGSDVEWHETELVQEWPTIDRWTSAMPDDAHRVGLDRTTPEGQMVGFVAGLDPRRRGVRLFAWGLLLLFLGPLLVSLLLDLFGRAADAPAGASRRRSVAEMPRVRLSP